MPDDTNPNRPDKVISGDPASPDKKKPAADDPELDKAAKESREGVEGKLPEDKLNVPGALEVEDMPASSELQDRRKQTKRMLDEMVSDEDIDEAFEDEGGGLMDMLRESNLSPKHLKFCCGGVFVLILLVGTVWGGMQLYAYLSDKAGQQSSVIETVNTDSGDSVVDDGSNDDGSTDSVPTNIAQSDFETSYESLDVSLYPGIFIGENLVIEDNATNLGQDIGEELTSDDSLAGFISEFADMYESLQVDVQQLLDASHDRQATLDDYQDQLNYFLYNGRQNLADLRVQAASLSELLTESDGKKAYYEGRFFDQLKQLDTYASVGALNNFVSSSQKSIELKAQYQAREKLISYYEQTMVSLEARISDITLNEEALVKGVQVVDISGSDINLIIDESEL